ncbi:hypothetical protein Ct9H90mP29_00580 [bacterium]|nr:MAG: hypothetical protein Ct9H90mP29_00580 [bacterium]
MGCLFIKQVTCLVLLAVFLLTLLRIFKSIKVDTRRIRWTRIKVIDLSSRSGNSNETHGSIYGNLMSQGMTMEFPFFKEEIGY